MNGGELISILREAGWPVAAIAEIFRAERRTVYAWLDGGQPDEITNSRISYITDLLVVTNVHLPSLYRVFNRTLPDGSSIRLLLSAQTLDRQAIAHAFQMLAPAIERHTNRDRMRCAPRPGARNPIIDEMPEAGSAI